MIILEGKTKYFFPLIMKFWQLCRYIAQIGIIFA